MSTSRVDPGRAQFFVIDGSIKRLSCDAWLLPTDAFFNLTAAFVDDGGPSRSDVRDATREWNGRRVLPCGERRTDQPWPWLGRIGTTERESLSGVDRSELEAVVDEFFRTASVALSEVRERGRRPRLAINVIGTGAGGTARVKGQTTRALVDMVPGLARLHDVDAVLVAWGAKAYSAAQSYRREVSCRSDSDIPEHWDLGPVRRHTSLIKAAHAMAALVQREGLVLFLGAGVSMAAGGPAWETLIRGLARDRNLPGFDIDDAIQRADLRDIATVLARAYADEEEFRDAIRKQVDRGYYGLLHGLLASIRVREAVTTNYDHLYEIAATTAGRTLGVLPDSPPLDPGDPWLLKLHGSIEGDVVLTRADYVGAAVRHAALFGLVQALLVTRHMLFVGYSLRDEDFHQVVHDVRLAMPRKQLGTALVLVEDAFQRLLWGDELDLVHMVDAAEARELGDQAAVHAVASRRLEVFLDLVGVLAVREYPYALDPTYSEKEASLGPLGALRDLDVTKLASDGPEGRLRRLLAELGHPDLTDV